MNLPLRELFLQMFFAFFPILSFYVGYREGKETSRTHVALFLLSITSLTCCIYFCIPNWHFYLFDLRFIPILIGLWYGSWRTVIALVAGYIMIRLFMLGGGDRFVAFLLVHTLFITLALLSKRVYRSADLQGKLVSFTVILLFGIFLNLCRYSFDIIHDHIVTSVWENVVIGLFILFLLMAGWAVVFLIESIIDKHKAVFSLQRLMDAVPSAISTIDKEGRLLSVNDALLKEFPVFQGQRNRLIGQHFRIMTDQYGIDFRHTGLYKALMGEEMRNVIFDYPKHTLLVSAYPLRNPATEEIEGAISISNNVTEVRELRAKINDLERLSLVGQMAASVAHEIRNPMTSIRGFVQLMSKSPIDPDHPHNGYYQIILEELDRVNGIIEDFLSLSRNRVVNKEPADLNGIIEELSLLLWAEANLKGVGVEFKLESALPSLQLDKKEIKQLLLNLSRNAFDAMEKDGTLTIRTELDTDQESVRLEVEDTGCGMSRETLEQLFQPFFTTKSSGTGLGLTACKNIVERHGGRFEINSREGEGTTFTVLFPKGDDASDSNAGLILL